MRVCAALLSVALLLSFANAAAADDGDLRFRRTTPRAVLTDGMGAVVIGIPGGRAWGIESGLRPLPPAGTVLVVRLTVSDESVKEAFVRVAYYASSSRRTRQLAITDSPLVAASVRALVAVELDPPAGAVAYRVRVLGRVESGSERSSGDAISAAFRPAAGASRWPGSLYSRLLP